MNSASAPCSAGIGKNKLSIAVGDSADTAPYTSQVAPTKAVKSSEHATACEYPGALLYGATMWIS